MRAQENAFLKEKWLVGSLISRDKATEATGSADINWCPCHFKNACENPGVGKYKCFKD